MKENKKRTLYFLDWLKEEYDIDPNIWLDNMRPENNGGNQETFYNRFKNIEDFLYLDGRKLDAEHYIDYSFLWEYTDKHILDLLDRKNLSISDLDVIWVNICDSIENKNFSVKFEKYKDYEVIDFSKYPIADYKLIKPKSLKPININFKNKSKEIL